ncbi:LIM domain transcription factor -like isoform X2 [Paramuricea clavata]|uniref:LIM domain transcription factor -like isoform X2 n=1 Tax=Paramuricea clavata TaxID=317549 RepID=A0A7D9EN27_PARCT|nr:LIM domain transcription factor -like isoform X2 [Paramuricea clavata]
MQSSRNMSCESKSKSCAACGRTILERFLLHALDKYWHMDCLQCSCCNVRLGEVGTSCFSKGGMILCKNDYLRLYGSSGGACAVCQELIPAAEMVMKIRDKAYHMRCFTCCACHTRLVTGDRIHFVNDRIFCESDYPLALRSMATTPTQQQQPIFC